MSLKVIVLVLRRKREILGIYIRNSKREFIWDPGLSDIDLTVVVHDCDPEDHIAFLTGFWRTYSRLKMFFPVLGELELFSVIEFKEYLKYGPTSLSHKKLHVCLYDHFSAEHRVDINSLVEVISEKGDAHHGLRASILRYIRFVYPAGIQYAHYRDFLRLNLWMHADEIFNNTLVSIGDRIDISSDRLSFDDIDPFNRFVASLAFLSGICERQNTGIAEHTVDITGSTTELPVTDFADFVTEVESAASICGVENITVNLWNTFGVRGKYSLALVVSEGWLSQQAKQFMILLAPIYSKYRSLFTQYIYDYPSDIPPVLTKSIWTMWMQLFPFESASFTAHGISLLGNKKEQIVYPSAGDYLDYIRTEYAALFPLKNNWRGQTSTEVRQFYKEIIDQIQIYIQFINTNKIEPSYRMRDNDHACSLPALFQMYHDSLINLGNVLEKG
ncbi:hypothetical protein ACFL54_01345 [Planctomycetota bacterium]